MRLGRLFGGSLLAMAVLAGCNDTSQPTGPASTPEQARASQTCTITDDARAQVRTVTAGCTNHEVTVPEGWTLRVIGGGAAAAPRLPSVGPQQITQIENPTPEYVNSTDLLEISQIPDLTPVTSVSDVVQTVTFSVTMSKRSVPGTWGTWGSPPFTEGNMPHLLYSNGATTVEMTLAEPSSIFGFELNPNPFSLETYTVEFYSGATLVGSITRQIHGDAGARLLAARSDGSAFDRVVVSGTADFGIARLRYAIGVQQPPIPVDIHAVFSGPPNRDPNQISLDDPSVFVQILNIEQYLPRPASPNDVRIGDDFATGVPAEDFVILDINNDGVLDIQLRFSTQALINAGHLGPNTTTILVWGQDPTDGQLYAGEAQVQIIGPGGEPRTLSTAPANNGSGGVFMDLTPTRLVHVVSFDSPLSGTVGTVVDVEVWTRPGTYVGFDGDPTGWTLTQTVQATRAGTTVNAPIELTSPIALQPNTTTAVYLQVVSAGGGLRYTGTAGSPPQTTWSNADLTLFSDVARVTAVPFAGTRFTPRTFSGNVNYLIFP
jgi:hypothetical protein